MSLLPVHYRDLLEAIDKAGIKKTKKNKLIAIIKAEQKKENTFNQTLQNITR